LSDVTEAGPAPKKPRAKKKHADPILRLRQAAWNFFAKRRVVVLVKKPRSAKTVDPLVAFRKASWAQLHAPKKPPVIVPKGPEPLGEVARKHLKAVLEALIFAAEQPLSLNEVSKSAQADRRIVRILLAELVYEFKHRGFRLDEIAGGFVFRTSPAYAPFVREQVAKKPVRMTRAQIETLAIVAYRQPVTRPEVDDVRGVDSGATLKTLLERDLVRILGKKDEPGRPMIYGTTNVFLNFFGLKALGDLPTLREFTELSDESRRTFERELGEEAPDLGPPPADGYAGAAARGLMGGEGDLRHADVEIVPDSFSYDASGEAPPDPANDEEVDGEYKKVDGEYKKVDGEYKKVDGEYKKPFDEAQEVDDEYKKVDDEYKKVDAVDEEAVAKP
jgi:segregation and condensation protein B